MLSKDIRGPPSLYFIIISDFENELDIDQILTGSPEEQSPTLPSQVERFEKSLIEQALAATYKRYFIDRI